MGLRRKKRPGLFAQGENCSAVPPVFRVFTLHFISTDILCSSNVELTLTPTWHINNIPLGSLLEGYFYNSFTKASTCRFLSALHNVIYSSLSLHFRMLFSYCLLVIIIHLEIWYCQVTVLLYSYFILHHRFSFLRDSGNPGSSSIWNSPTELYMLFQIFFSVFFRICIKFYF